MISGDDDDRVVCEVLARETVQQATDFVVDVGDVRIIGVKPRARLGGVAGTFARSVNVAES